MEWLQKEFGCIFKQNTLWKKQRSSKIKWKFFELPWWIKTKHSTWKWKFEQFKSYNMYFDSNETQFLKGKNWIYVSFLGKVNSFSLGVGGWRCSILVYGIAFVLLILQNMAVFSGLPYCRFLWWSLQCLLLWYIAWLSWNSLHHSSGISSNSTGSLQHQLLLSVSIL